MKQAAAVFDEERLKWMNGIYLRSRSREEFAELALPFLVQQGLTTEAAMRTHWGRFVELLAQVQEHVRTLAEVPPYVDFCFQEVVYDEQAVQKLLTEEHRRFLHCVATTLWYLHETRNFTILASKESSPRPPSASSTVASSSRPNSRNNPTYLLRPCFVQECAPPDAALELLAPAYTTATLRSTSQFRCNCPTISPSYSYIPFLIRFHNYTILVYSSIT